MTRLVRTLLYGSIICFTCWFFNPLSTQIVDEPLKPYFNEFVSISNEMCPGKVDEHPNYEVTLEPLNDDDIAGICSTLYFKFTVKINSKYWNKYDEDDKFQLVAHELSHCFYNIQHTDNPNNYMYFTLNKLIKPITLNQLKADFRKHCGK